MQLTRKTIERTEIQRPASTEYRGEHADFDIFVTVGEDGTTDIAMVPKFGCEIRLPLLKFFPRSVSELEELANRLPAALNELASALRVEGLEDLRSRYEKRQDEFEEKLRESLER